jgi:hypothetical protein
VQHERGTLGQVGHLYGGVDAVGDFMPGKRHIQQPLMVWVSSISPHACS